MGCCSPSRPQWRVNLDRFLAHAVVDLMRLFDKTLTALKQQRASTETLRAAIREAIPRYLDNPDADDHTRFVHYVHMLSPVKYAPFHVPNSPKQLNPKEVAKLKADAEQLEQLANMVERQIETARKMQKAVKAFKGREAMLVQDYICFLLLFRQAKRGTVLVPTLLVDVVWHAHMRYPAMYARDTRQLCGFFLDHSDEIPEDELERQRVVTQRQMRECFSAADYGTTLLQGTTVLIAPCAGHPASDTGAGARATDSPTSHLHASCGGGDQNRDPHHHHHNGGGHTLVGGNTSPRGGHRHSSLGGHRHSSLGVHHHSSLGADNRRRGTDSPTRHVSSGAGEQHRDPYHHNSSCGGGHTLNSGGGNTSSCGGHTSSCGGHHHSSCGGHHHSTCGGHHHSSCGGATTTITTNTSACGGATTSCGGATTSACGGGATTSACGGGATTSACGGGATSSCGGGGSSCGGS